MTRARMWICMAVLILLVASGCSESPMMSSDESQTTSSPGNAVSANALFDNPAFDLMIDFDTDPLGQPIEEETDIYNQYEMIGVIFRDTLSYYYEGFGGSPGEIEAEENPLSPPNVLEAEDDVPGVYVLFQEPVFGAGAYVLSDEDDDEEGVQTIYLDVYDEGLNLIATTSVDALSSTWTELSYISEIPIAAARFYSYEVEDEDDCDDDGDEWGDDCDDGGHEDGECGEGGNGSDGDEWGDDCDHEGHDDEECDEGEDEDEEYEEFYLDDFGVISNPGGEGGGGAE